MNQTERILHDLKQGLVVNMLDDIKRYGTSMRSRISELRKIYRIEDKVIHESGAKAYFMPKHVKAREELLKIIDETCPIKSIAFCEIERVYKKHDDYFMFKDLELPDVVKLLKRGYTLIPF